MRKLILFLTVFVMIYNVAKSQQETQNDSRFEVGVGIGNPAIVNLNLLYHYKDFFVRSSGMYWGDLYGSQWDFGYKFYDKNSMYHGLSLNIGTYEFPANNTNLETGPEGKKWDFFGCSYIFSISGFYIQPGFSIGRGNNENPSFLAAIGYNFKF